MEHGGRKQAESWTSSQTYHTGIQAHWLQHFGRGDGTASNEGAYLPVDLKIGLWRTGRMIKNIFLHDSVSWA